MDIGVRELRDNLSRHLAHVRSVRQRTLPDPVVASGTVSDLVDGQRR